MLTDKDIEKLTDALVSRDEFHASNTKILDEVFATHKDLQGLKDEMNQKFSGLQNSIDGLAKVIADYTQELKMLASKVDRHEKWILQIAEKLDLKLKT
ncbi:MAG: hypothetical protein AUJ11_01230 [Parcubacteria group bacterium CG1_02_44_65]|uniref:Uncharacterized protein n=2 Tax=Candidatus Portnoyibacteriota TaxID=1817913 RepID=A0A2M7YM56_9BACT|nr:MAG: hypothetical protein AUJ11_01230 [Parcubacteria group bacterium CG1_02_44_65]PIP15581.1 MAG: hypothetical protein COX45_01885 [Candidatus Portnoybacteria bacterium CG23_combo_of_CG06-09_8_20_14_all_44_36]PJA64059.1 MAG: hypothetical protein CO160_00605 [Candidatus Portnoybacteria bacterium CG_4_9_14_3_um_filter_43_11]PJE59227.1 MAG: hypothetical protein COU84_01890 [Candidatus Portnoybacteria bacterium CG10_big_fil_rev_8_21_14_0_10_43_39]